MGIKTIMLSAIGFLALLLGGIGLVVPVFPTTPFVIVAAACFSGIPTLQKKLINAPFFGDHIKNYKNKTGLTKKTVAVSLIFLWGMLLISAVIINTPIMWAILSFIGVTVTVHILMMAKGKKGCGEG